MSRLQSVWVAALYTPRTSRWRVQRQSTIDSVAKATPPDVSSPSTPSGGVASATLSKCSSSSNPSRHFALLRSFAFSVLKRTRRREGAKKREEFVGWGSSPPFDALNCPSVGMNPTLQMLSATNMRTARYHGRLGRVEHGRDVHDTFASHAQFFSKSFPSSPDARSTASVGLLRVI